MLGGGVPSGAMTALIGAPGSGKTLLGLHLLNEGLRQGRHAVYFGLYEAPPRLLSKAKGVGLPLEAYVKQGALRLLWTQPTEQLLDQMADSLLSEVEAAGASHVFIDGADGMQQAAAHPDRFNTFFTALSNELRARNVTAAVSLEASFGGPQLGMTPVGLSATVENIVLLRYVELRSQLHRLISILKVRESAYDPSLREFRITPQGLEVAQTFESAESVLGEAAAQGAQPPASPGHLVPPPGGATPGAGGGGP
jgi:circadian clock protein KaiC